MSSSPFLVGKFDDYLYIKFFGEITMKNVFPLKKFFKSVDLAEFDHVVIDFQKAVYLDSTSLGIIASTAIKFSRLHNSVKITLVNVNDDLMENFVNFGFNRIADLEEHHFKIIEQNLVPLPEEDEQVSGKDILEAHKSLVNLNENNRKIFKNVIELLEKEIEKN